MNNQLIANLWEAIGHHSAQIAETEEMAPGEKLLAAMRAVEESLEAQLNPQGERDEAASRYERLRILGCAPYGSKQLEAGTVLRFQSLDAFVDADLVAHPSRGEAGLQELTDIAQANSLWNAESVKENAESLQRAVAVFDGYIDDMPVIKWLGEAVPAGTEFYAQVKETGIPLTRGDAHVKATDDRIQSVIREFAQKEKGCTLLEFARAILQAAQPVAPTMQTVCCERPHPHRPHECCMEPIQVPAPVTLEPCPHCDNVMPSGREQCEECDKYDAAQPQGEQSK